MCGIAGIWHYKSPESIVSTDKITRMTDTLRHRGPDDAGVLCSGPIGFGHRRLSIIDLSPQGHQPMVSPGGRFWLTFNGEIHNYLELRDALPNRDYPFQSHTDSEVILAAYEAWGIECFERFNGMWALAIWDRDRRELVLARDRFGIKPLYYHNTGQSLVFASECKAILAVCPAAAEPNEAEIVSFFGRISPHTSDATYFRRIRSVPQSSCLRLRPDGSSLHHKTWLFEPGERVHPETGREEHFLELLRDAVRIRLRSDEEVGACLSGGLDSSSIVRLAGRISQRPVQCFTTRYDDTCDESGFARLAAQDSIEHEIHWVEPDPDQFLKVLDQIVWYHDAPPPMRGRFPQWFTFKRASERVKVVLDGQGADELVAGYAYKSFFPYSIDHARQIGSGWLNPTAAWHRMFPRGAQDGMDWRRLRPWIKETLRYRYIPRLDSLERAMSPEFARAHGPVKRRLSHWGWFHPESPQPFSSYLNNALWHEFRVAGLPELLHAEDALSMAFSLEARHPFLDHRLVEFCFSLPFHEKIRDGWTKSILRRATAGVLPEPIRWRRDKLGFPAPYSKWLQNPKMLGTIRDRLEASPLMEGNSVGLLRRAGLKHLFAPLHSAQPAPTEAFDRIWRLLALDSWWRQFRL